MYAATKTIAWDYSQDRPYKGDTITSDRRMYIHLYYNPEKAAADEVRQTALLIRLRDELVSGHRKSEHDNQYKKFFTVHETPIRGTKVEVNEDAVQKAFGNLKERLNCRRMLTSSDLAMEGKLFVEFIALIYLSYIKGKMQENGLFAEYTMRQRIDELDVIECYETPGNAGCTPGFRNGYDDWGKGYTVEGMRALMDHAVKVYGAHRFEGECAKANIGSARVMQKLGMKFEKNSSYTKSDGSLLLTSNGRSGCLSS